MAEHHLLSFRPKGAGATAAEKSHPYKILLFPHCWRIKKQCEGLTVQLRANRSGCFVAVILIIVIMPARSTSILTIH